MMNSHPAWQSRAGPSPFPTLLCPAILIPPPTPPTSGSSPSVPTTRSLLVSSGSCQSSLNSPVGQRHHAITAVDVGEILKPRYCVHFHVRTEPDPCLQCLRERPPLCGGGHHQLTGVFRRRRLHHLSQHEPACRSRFIHERIPQRQTELQGKTGRGPVWRSTFLT